MAITGSLSFVFGMVVGMLGFFFWEVVGGLSVERVFKGHSIVPNYSHTFILILNK